ncbi:MAG: hypothetical protein ACK4ND_15560 [Cytophagaceae bacterium]
MKYLSLAFLFSLSVTVFSCQKKDDVVPSSPVSAPSQEVPVNENDDHNEDPSEEELIPEEDDYQEEVPIETPVETPHAQPSPGGGGGSGGGGSFPSNDIGMPTPGGSGPSENDGISSNPGSGNTSPETEVPSESGGTTAPIESSKNPAPVDAYSNFRQYVIRAGSHSSNSGIKLLSKNDLTFKAVFDESAKYTIATNKQGDMNKLYGFSDLGSHHHTNSARFGWRWYKDKLQIFAYTYANGKRNMKHITNVDPGKDYVYSIRIKGDKYHFSVNDKSCIMDRGGSGNGMKYYLYPYFGGTTKAPHDVKIRILDM